MHLTIRTGLLYVVGNWMILQALILVQCVETADEFKLLVDFMLHGAPWNMFFAMIRCSVSITSLKTLCS